jgi:hypothetical protein
MYGLGSGEKPWSCSFSFNPCVDFCIWVLEADGLHVPPFDHHPSGGGPLQAAGLHAEEWWSWFKFVVNLQHQQAMALQDPARSFTNEWWKSVQEKGGLPQDIHLEAFKQLTATYNETLRETIQAQPATFFPLIAQAYNPPAVWTGNPAVGARLAELWEQYQPLSNTRRGWEKGLGRRWSQAKGDGTGEQLWKDLEPYRTQLDSLIIHFVAYPQPVECIVHPVSIILAVANGQLDGSDFRRRVLDVIGGLTASKNS